jgi:GT2 family glycosyltransferase
MFKRIFYPNRLKNIPRSYAFKGYLDAPMDDGRSNVVSGWYLSRKRFHKVVACLNGKEIFEIEQNTVRKDAERMYRRSKYPKRKRIGFYRMIPKDVIEKHLGGRAQKKGKVSVRFYTDEKRYADKYKTIFVLYNKKHDLFKNKGKDDPSKRFFPGRVLSFLSALKNRISPEIPLEYEFEGHLDTPGEGKHSNMVSGWYLSRKRFYKVVACLNGKEILEIKQNAMRKDVALTYCGANYTNAENSGFKYTIPGHIISKYIGKRAQGEVKICIRFYIDKYAHVDNFQKRFILYRNEYDAFYSNEEKMHKGRDVKKELKSIKYKPKISIIVPVCRPNKKYFMKMAKSVLGQVYPNLEFCVCFDGRQDILEHILEKMDDRRIKAVVNDRTEGISNATNRALSLATGEFVAFVDHDDALHKYALLETVKALNKDRKADLVYTDEDKVDEKDRHSMPFFKPDYSPHQLLCHNYICHLLVARKSLIDQLNGLRTNPGIEGSQDWDLILRILERTDRVLHIPKVLYSWRYYETSVSQKKRKKEAFLGASKRVLGDYIKRNKLKANVANGLVPDTYKIDFPVIGRPKVSIIMPTGGKMRLLRKAINSITGRTSYGNYEIVLIDNSDPAGKEGTEVKAFVRKIRSKRIRYFRYGIKPFNFSKLVNYGARRAKGEYLLLLNDDISVMNKDWLSEMLKVCQQKNVGAVGAKLYYENNTIQHVGVVLGLFGVCEHVFKGTPWKDHGYFCSNYVYKDYLAVTGACLMTKRRLFLGMGCLDEKHLKVAYQDIDYCLKLHKKSLFVVFTPYAELYHYEGLTKKVCVARGEYKYLCGKWKKYIDNDPFYNPNLSRDSLEFRLK